VKCPNCNKTINLKLKFCPYCGKMISKKKFKGKKDKIPNRRNSKSKYIKKSITKKGRKTLRSEGIIKKENKTTTTQKIKTNKQENEIKKNKSKEKSKKVKDKSFIYEYALENYSKIDLENLAETDEEDIKKAMERKFKYHPIPECNIYHSLYSDIYFIYDYIRSPTRTEFKKNNTLLSNDVNAIVKTSEKLMGYKYHDEYEYKITKNILNTIKSIFNTQFKDKDGVALISLPPSEKGKIPQTKKTIDLIEEWDKNEKFKLDFKIHNSYDLLIRHKTVTSSKNGDRRLKKHFDSIIYNKDKDLSNSNMGVIILDDITTSGNSMYACRSILIDNGFDNKDIISLAIARTVNVMDLKRANEGVILDEDSERVERYKYGKI